MKIRHVFGGLLVAAVVASTAACGGTSSGDNGNGGAKTVTIYSADGLADWYKPEFTKFTQQTGITVNYVEAGSSEVVSRIEKEKSNPQADVIVTLPPFIQQADKDGMLGALGVDTSAVDPADKDANGHWTALINNYSCFIYNNGTTAPKTWQDLLSPALKGKLQYSTPGQAGDGTAVLILLEYEMGKPAALDYLKQLQANNVGPSSSTGKLQPKVSTGDLLVANGDVQMNLSSVQNDKSNFTVFFPANGTAAPETLALPYDMGLTANAPHADAGKKLMTFLLSADAQQQASGLAFGIPVRTDVHATDGNAAKLQTAVQGVTIYHPDWNAVLADLDADVAAYNSAIGS